MFALLTGFMLYKKNKRLFLNPFFWMIPCSESLISNWKKKRLDWGLGKKMEEGHRKTIDYFKDIL